MKLSTSYIKLILIIVHDILISIIAWFFAFLLRFDFQISDEYRSSIIDFLPLIIILQGFIFIKLSIYRSAWRSSSVKDLKKIIVASVLIVAIYFLILFVIKPSFTPPNSIPFLYAFLLIFGTGGNRLIYRLICNKQFYIISSNTEKKPVIIIGSGSIAFSLINELSLSEEWLVVGIIDNDPSLRNRSINGIFVFGAIPSISKVCAKHSARHVIVADKNLTPREKQQIAIATYDAKINLLIFPIIDDIISPNVTLAEIRPISVEDLLGRDSINLNTAAIEGFIEGQNIIVSGAAGSIGSELCRQILKYKPNNLICLDNSEQGLYELDQELSNDLTRSNLSFIAADITNEALISKIFIKYKPKTIFHAAAYKHVPLMEHNNVAECIRNNVMGTYVLAREAKKTNVGKFILISSDKAVNPTNVMGATKRMSEMVCQSVQEKTGTLFAIVRFGNVIGSSGSVIPKFRKQIQQGGPITVTHPEIIRYFMSIPEAAQLVMESGVMTKGGEIFVLDMGDPVKIIDLAKNMIKLSGFSKDEIKIEFTGLRPGEKLYEELLMQDDKLLPTHNKNLFIANGKVINNKKVDGLIKWVEKISENSEEIIKNEIKDWVDEYKSNDQS